jgi:hypothetical protein
MLIENQPVYSRDNKVHFLQKKYIQHNNNA